MPFKIPEISQADIESFHAAHFNDDALSLFQSQFLRLGSAQHAGTGNELYEEEDYDDDGLGYYPDGVKRTLTDEQIAIFRHSELEALRRAETKASNVEVADVTEPDARQSDKEGVFPLTRNGSNLANADAMVDDGEGSEEGEIETEKPILTKAEIRRQKKLRTRQKRRENQRFQPEKKPDLRKRTWDVVEAGMDSLHYDDLGLSQDHGCTSTMPRKQISYDD
ncbi:hypothetical protein GGR50DRAFT_84011 [Xylaria sp. CBS 124048]|nr:hypothetical protein GGR50DRAFT_84011 [Xylaria sp. CBS 124048]